MTEFRAGAASLPLEPPLGLPMVGFIRQPWNARGYGLPLEVGALVLERGDTRVVLCGVDVVGIIHPQIEPLIDRVAAATGAAPRRNPPQPEPHAPGASRGRRERCGLRRRRRRGRKRRSRRSRACCTTRSSPSAASQRERLEPAGVVWGQADVDLAVNRRERTTDGSNGGSILGWNPDELVDNQVTVLQARRPDESAIAHARRVRVSPGHHRATTWTSTRPTSRGRCATSCASVSGGECVFFQGAGGNVLPKFAFTDTEDEARRMGTRLGLAALEAVADRFSRDGPRRAGGGGLGDADHPLPPAASREPPKRRRSPPRARPCRSRCCRTRRSRRSSG